VNGTSSGMYRTAAGTLTLRSGTGIIVSASLNSAVDGQETVINSDDNGGTWTAAVAHRSGLLTISPPAHLNSQNGQLTITASDLNLQGTVNTGTSTLLLTVSRSGTPIGVGATLNTQNGFTVDGDEMQRVTSSGLALGNAISSNIEVNGVTNANSQAISGIFTLTATNQNAAISFLESSSTFSALSATADDGIDVEKSLTSTLGGIILEGDADNTDDGKSRDHIYFISGLSLTSNQDIDLNALTGGVKLAGPVAFNAKRHIYLNNKFTGPFGAHTVTVQADTDNDGDGRVFAASLACSIYNNAASCIASKICAWCGAEPKTIGNGMISTQGGDARQIVGIATEFVADNAFVVDNLVSVGGQFRKITSVTSDTTATIELKFLSTPSGSISVYAGALDQIVGSAPSKFDKELRPGYTITADGITATVDSVQSYKSFTAIGNFATSKNDVLYTIGNINGAGSLSTDSGTSVTVTGSWPPSATRFLTQLQPGSYITVGSETRVVASVTSNQVITVTTPFTKSFRALPYTISNVPGTGSISFSSGTMTGVGSDLTATEFTKQLKIGDVIMVSGQTRMVQTITDDQHLSVSAVFSTEQTHSAFQMGNVHDTSFTLAKKAAGTVYTSTNKIYGIATQFSKEIEIGYKVVVKVGSSYEQRTVVTIDTDTQITVSSPFSAPITNTDANRQQLHYQSCPSQGANLDESESGTFALHAKSARPSICYNTGRCVPQASHKATFATAGQGIISGATTSAVIQGTGTDFASELKIGDSISVSTGTQLEAHRVISITSATSVVVDTPFTFDFTFAQNLPYTIHYLVGSGVFTNAGGDDYTVHGTGTRFVQELDAGYVIAIGDEKRVVTSIVSETQMTISTPFNYLNGGVTASGFAYEACMSGDASTPKQITLDYATLDPGCCGFKVTGAVAASNFAYYNMLPPSTNYNLRIITDSPVAQLEVFMRYTHPPDAINYDFKAVGTSPPYQIELPQNRLRCPTNAASCDSLWVGIRGLGGGGPNIPFEVSAYLEFNFPSFACAESSLGSLSAKCDALGLKQQGDATFINDASDALNAGVMRLTSQQASQTGAVWYNSKVHLENGFETSFTFKMNSECTTSSTTGCGAGDGFALVIQGSNTTSVIGCGGSSMGFAANSATPAGCTGIDKAFAVEFDTWHNPELRDINVRGVGTVEVNASVVPRYNYVHTAFFSNGQSSLTNSHDAQLAGTPAIPAINDGTWHTGRVVYIPGTSSSAPGRMFLYIDDMQSFVLTAPIRLTKEGACGTASTDRCVLDTFGNAFLGFTAATGEMGQSHDVAKWLFCDEPGCGRE